MDAHHGEGFGHVQAKFTAPRDVLRPESDEVKFIRIVADTAQRRSLIEDFEYPLGKVSFIPSHGDGKDTSVAWSGVSVRCGRGRHAVRRYRDASRWEPSGLADVALDLHCGGQQVARRFWLTDG